MHSCPQPGPKMTSLDAEREKRKERRRRLVEEHTNNEVSQTSGASEPPERIITDLEEMVMIWDERGIAQRNKQNELRQWEEELKREKEKLQREKDDLKQEANAIRKELENEGGRIKRDKEKLEKTYQDMREMEDREQRLIETLQSLDLDWVLSLDYQVKVHVGTQTD